MKTPHSAKLNVVINPNGGETQVTFEYGKTIDYGSSVTAPLIPAGWDDVPAETVIDGLDGSQEYHWRARASNSAGEAKPGSDVIFTTLQDQVEVPVIVSEETTDVT